MIKVTLPTKFKTPEPDEFSLSGTYPISSVNITLKDGRQIFNRILFSREILLNENGQFKTEDILSIEKI